MPWMRKYRRLAALLAERGTRVTTEEQDSSFSWLFSIAIHLSLCDMHHPCRRSFILTALSLGACTAASEHSDKQHGPPAPTAQPAAAAPAAATRQAPAASAETVSVSNGAVATVQMSRAMAALRDPATTPVIRGLYV